MTGIDVRLWADLIADALVSAKLVQPNDLKPAIEVIKEEIRARLAMYRDICEE